MAKVTERLTNGLIASIVEPGLYADGGGLYLQVTAGGRSWLFKYTLRGRTHEMGLGSLKAFTLVEARKRARAARQQLADGVDPLAAKRAQRAQNRADRGKTITFKQEAEAYIRAHCRSWKNDKHGNQWRSTMQTYVYPIIGAVPVFDVDTKHVVEILEPIWPTKTETAHRVRGRIERVLNRAASQGHRQGENPARWKGHLEHVFPNRRRVSPVVHHPALPYGEMAGFMTALRRQNGAAARALELTILCAVRTSDTIGATWSEIDLERGIWILPLERTKTRELRVPLSPAAAALIRQLEPGGRDQYLFRGHKDNPLSNNAMLALLRRMRRRDITVHGFRSTFKDWAADCTEFDNIVSEMALAHSIGDQTEEAYRRSDLFERRRQLMLKWAHHCLPTALVAAGGDVRQSAVPAQDGTPAAAAPSATQVRRPAIVGLGLADVLGMTETERDRLNSALGSRA